MTDEHVERPGELRLFPLNSVLFPGQNLPLNVFEPRYLQLVQECVEADEPFGVVLIREGLEAGGPALPFDVGTTARLVDVQLGALTNLSALARGGLRFRIRQLHRDRPYLWAEVDYLEEVSTEPPAGLVDRARELIEEIKRLMATGRGEYASEFQLPTAPGELADAAGAMRLASPTDSQELLETLDTGARLSRAVELLEVAERLVQKRIRRAATRRWSQPGGLN